jgi:uracil phosphoribosyltransferase
LARYLTYEAARDLPVNQTEIETPLTKTTAQWIDETKIILAPILRAGLAMIEGAIATFPHAQVRHIGLFRDEQTLQPVEYYVKLPAAIEHDMLAIILDPMLATGGSAIATIDVFKRRGVTRFKFICLIASPEGLKAVVERHPDVPIYTASVDSHLNDRGYIVPGLGDAGDRCFGTG